MKDCFLKATKNVPIPDWGGKKRNFCGLKHQVWWRVDTEGVRGMIILFFFIICFINSFIFVNVGL